MKRTTEERRLETLGINRALAPLADRLNNIRLKTDVTALSRAELGARTQSLLEGAKHCCSLLGSGAHAYWTVNISLRGIICRIGHLKGTTSPEYAELIFRFADMVRLYFWQYKQRGARRSPVDADFNYSFAQAQLDTKNETELLELIHAQESVIKGCGLLLQLPEKETRATPIRQLDSRVGSLQLELHKLTGLQDDTAKKLEDIRQFQSTLVGLIQGILHRLNDTTNQVAPETKPC